MAAMTDLLFVYGTLMRGYDHPMARLLSAHADFVAEATCRGRLHLIRHYPGLVMSDEAQSNADDIVHGELFRLTQPEALLRELDLYEACGDGFAEPTEYRREVQPVITPDGASHPAWTYIYNWPVDTLPRIASGKFSTD
jgi:gamma-glutamylcyclotransferase (GGCT)/AIG2-like uncharacterized protein YtfP